MARFIFYAVVAWLVFRWLDLLSGSRRRNNFFNSFSQYDRNSNSGNTRQTNPPKDKNPNSDNIGDYVDFEEVDE